MYKEKLAIVDIGSNTVRLVIYGIDSDFYLTELINIKTPARLSQHLAIVDGEKVMDQAGIDKLVLALESFRLVTEEHQVDTIKPLATAAIRQSSNQADILSQVYDRMGWQIEIVPEEDEASYGQYAIMHSTSYQDAITIDIGGGSCEITLFENKQMKEAISFPFGTVSLKEQFFEGKAHNDQEIMEEVAKYVSKHFKQVAWLKKAKLPIVAVGGSARNVTLVHQRATNYPIAGIHGYHLSLDDLEFTLNLFASTALDKMSDIDGLSSDRVDIIIPANLVFIELFNTVKAPTFTISMQGLREGIALSYINSTYDSPLDTELIKARAIRNVIRLFPINVEGAQLRVNTCLNLYKQMCDLEQFKYSYQTQEMLEFSAYLYMFGSFISGEAESQHTFYLLSNMNLFGFSHIERLRLALLSSFRNRSLFNQYLEDFDGWFSESTEAELQKLGGVIKFCQALNDSQTAPIQNLDLIRQKDGDYTLTIEHQGPIVAEEYRTDRHKKHLERALDGKLSLNYLDIT